MILGPYIMIQLFYIGRVHVLPRDHKRNLEELCKIKFDPQREGMHGIIKKILPLILFYFLFHLQDCRCKVAHNGTGHCIIQYFEYWRQVDHEVHFF